MLQQSQIRPKITAEGEIAVLRFFRMLVVQDPRTLDNCERYEQETGRTYFDPDPLMRYQKNPLFIQANAFVEWNYTKHQSRLAHLAEKARKFDALRPTLLRLALPEWMEQAYASGRTKRNKELRSAAVHAVVLRSIETNSKNVLMSWDSLKNMLTNLTGTNPGDNPIRRIFEWLDSGESPLTVVRKGTRGQFGRSTIIEVPTPEVDWRQAETEQEQLATVAWLSEHDQLLGELLADEARRKKDRPQLKSRYAKAMEIREQLDSLFSDTHSIFSLPTTGNVMTTAPSLEIAVDEEDPLLLQVEHPAASIAHLIKVDDLLLDAVSEEETLDDRVARLFPSLVGKSELLPAEVDLSRWAPSEARREREERLARVREEYGGPGAKASSPSYPFEIAIPQ